MRLYPEFYFDSIYGVTVPFLRENGIDALVLDVDNTMISNTLTQPDACLVGWVEELKRCGIRMCIVSNGNGKRVDKFNKSLCLPAVHKAAKPARKGFNAALDMMGCEKAHCAVLGDQLFTDVLGAHRAGLRAILVAPIDRFEPAFVRFKRILEKPFIRKIKSGRRGKWA